MNEPLEIAIRKISETRHLLELVVVSSEKFDYPKAQAALLDLQKKIKELARVQNDLQQQQPLVPSVVEFPRSRERT